MRRITSRAKARVMGIVRKREEANPFMEDLLRATVARAEDIVAYPAIYAVDQQAHKQADYDPSETVRGEVCSYIHPAVNDPSNE